MEDKYFKGINHEFIYCKQVTFRRDHLINFFPDSVHGCYIHFNFKESYIYSIHFNSEKEMREAYEQLINLLKL
jgi:hypothetical protein